MKLIELHILQSFPVSCLNRDDVGAPKTAVFGGVTRARISSQCLKRAIRLLAKDLNNGSFAGDRTRKAAEDLAEALRAQEIADADAQRIAQDVCHSFLSKTAPKKTKKKGKTAAAEAEPETEEQTSTLLYFSPSEIKAMAGAIAKARTDDSARTDFKAIAAKAVNDAPRKDAADIAIFGRMVANEASLTLEGAGLFSHALSTHRCDNDIDFFSAVDDRKEPGEDAGAGLIGTLEFTSAVYYRYVGLNLGLLADAHHLSALSTGERKQVVDTFLRASILAVPVGRKNSMNAHTLPGYVLGLVKDKGQPLQLVNAFEKPVPSKNGLIDASMAELKKHHDQLKNTWGIKPVAEVAIPDKSLDEFCTEILRHVA
jgi:CRISPR system Cascade subunit CasC